MPIEKPQFRPPQDQLCPMLRLNKGCAHGKCRFCDLYTREPFAMVPMEEVIADIEEIAKTATRMTRRIHFTGGNPFSLPTDYLVQVFDEVEKRIPSVRSYGGFCRVMDIARKTDEELALLASRGVNDLSIGAESGYDPALAFIQKGHTGADIVEQAQRLHKAGIDMTFFYLAGMAGAGKGQENAQASARVFSEANPQTILIVTLTPSKTWPLAEDIAAGRWKPPTEVETVEEIRTFIAGLDPETCTSMIIASHDSDVIRFEGLMPMDYKKMLQLMDNKIPRVSEAGARKMRGFIHRADYPEGSR